MGALRVFISRNLRGDSVLTQRLKEANMEVISASLIKILPVPFSHTPKTNWIFFSSKNGIKHFFAQRPEISSAVKFGVVSEQSAEFLRSYNVNPSFVGTGNDVAEIGKQFRAVIQDESVLFPMAMDSLQTVQKQLSYSNGIINLFTYKTLLRTDFNLPDCDVLVFTSPSNVRAYYSKYAAVKDQQVVAIGKATLLELRDHGVRNASLPKSFSEDDLADLVLRTANKAEILK